MHRNAPHTDRSAIRRGRIITALAMALLWLWGDLSISHAQSRQDQDWEITADQITYNRNTEIYTAQGNVRLTREGRVLTADSVRLDQKSRFAQAEGNVRLLSGQDVLTGSRLELDLDAETGVLHEGHLFFAQNHLYVSGDRILKTGPQTYFIHNASITTCDGPDPDWHITGKDLKITIEGYGYAKHTAFWIEELPVLYSPFLAFPVKLARQTGLLMPEFGLSDRKGAQYLQPFFWAISDSSDATFFTDIMAERGVRLGAEYRYLASPLSRGTFMADWLDDRRIDDGNDENDEQWGYPDDAFLRTNNDRYWLRGKINQELPWELTAKVDLDVVSDQDYLQDFKSGFNGFDKTEAVFLDTFGRELDDFTVPLRENQVNVNRLWTKYAFNANVRWYHDAVQDRPADSLTPLQDLPEITMDGIKQKIAGTPVYYDLVSSYSHFYRQTGDRGHRAELYPRVYYPARPFNALSLEPSAGIRQTVWHVDRYQTASPDQSRDAYRAIYDLKLDTSTDFYRIYPFAAAGWDRLKHNLRPQIIYQYVPDEDQSDLPFFDTFDRIEPQHRVTFALTNMLIARRPPPSGSTNRPAAYIPFLRFRLEEYFDIDKYKDDDPRPFSDLLGELDFRPGRYVNIDADFLWRPYDGEFYGYNLALNLWDKRGDLLSLDYRHTRATEEVQPIQTIRTNAVLQVLPRWQLRGRYEHDIQGKQFMEFGFGVSYMAQCWAVDLDYQEDAEDNSSILFMVHLAGLGTLGQ